MSTQSEGGKDGEPPGSVGSALCVGGTGVLKYREVGRVRREVGRVRLCVPQVFRAGQTP